MSKSKLEKRSFYHHSLPLLLLSGVWLQGVAPFWLIIPWVFKDLHWEAHLPPPPTPVFLFLTLEIGSKRYFSVVVVNTEKLGSEGCFRTVASSI